MPMPIPEGKNITVQYNERSGNFTMPSMEIATDHYNISYVISGDRRVITPLYSFTYHKGDVSVGEPYIYHRTVPESNEPYINYLIKFTPVFIEPFIEKIGKNIFDDIYERQVWHFSEETQKRIENMFSDMFEEYNKNMPYTETILQGMLYRLLITVHENKINGDIMKHSSPLTKPILDAIYYIENNYNENITLEKTAEKAHFSPSHFSRIFHSQLGMTFGEYLGNVRIRHAKRLLINTNSSIMEIALETGYCSGDYLSSQFKRKTGITPTQFRKIYITK